MVLCLLVLISLVCLEPHPIAVWASSAGSISKREPRKRRLSFDENWAPRRSQEAWNNFKPVESQDNSPEELPVELPVESQDNSPEELPVELPMESQDNSPEELPVELPVESQDNNPEALVFSPEELPDCECDGQTTDMVNDGFIDGSELCQEKNDMSFDGEPSAFCTPVASEEPKCSDWAELCRFIDKSRDFFDDLVRNASVNGSVNTSAHVLIISDAISGFMTSPFVANEEADAKAGIGDKAVQVLSAAMSNNSESLPADVAVAASAAVDGITGVLSESGWPARDDVLMSCLNMVEELAPSAVDNTTAGASVSQNILRTIEHLSTAASVGAAGQPVRSFSTDGGVQLTIWVPEDVSTLQNGVSQNGFDVPPLADDIVFTADDSNCAVFLESTNWPVNPYGFAGAGDLDVAIVGTDVVKTLTVRDCFGGEISVTGLVEPVSFWLPRQEQVDIVGYDQSGAPLVSERGCAFWSRDIGGWSEEGCEVDWNATTTTHVRCHCYHLTSFSASAKSALCKFCRVDINRFGLNDPSKWVEQRWDEPGIWWLILLIILLYIPFFVLCALDCRDWKPIVKNQSAYFRERAPGRGRDRYMICPPFRLCRGFIMVNGVHVRCPPQCCTCCKRKDSQINTTPEVLDMEKHRHNEARRLWQLGDTQRERRQALATLHVLRQMHGKSRYHWHGMDHMTDLYAHWFKTHKLLPLRRLLGIDKAEDLEEETPAVLRACYEIAAQGTPYEQARVEQLIRGESRRGASLEIDLGKTQEDASQQIQLCYPEDPAAVAMVSSTDPALLPREATPIEDVVPSRPRHAHQPRHETLLQSAHAPLSLDGIFVKLGIGGTSDSSSMASERQRSLWIPRKDLTANTAALGRKTVDIDDIAYSFAHAAPAAKKHSEDSLKVLPSAISCTLRNGHTASTLNDIIEQRMYDHCTEWIKIAVEVRARSGPDDPSEIFAGPAETLLRLSEGKGTAITHFLEGEGANSLDRVEFSWSFCPQHCVNKPEEDLCGVLIISRPLARMSSSSSLGAKSLSLALAVPTGSHMHEIWHTGFATMSRNGAEWFEREAFGLWRFQEQPVVIIEATPTSAHDFSNESYRHHDHRVAQDDVAVGLLAIPTSKAHSDEVDLPLQPLFAESGHTNNKSWGNVKLSYEWLPMGEAYAEDDAPGAAPDCYGGVLWLRQLAVHGRKNPCRLVARADTNLPTRNGGDMKVLDVPVSGKLEAELYVRHDRSGFNRDSMSGYFRTSSVTKDVWMLLARRAQYIRWSKTKLARKTYKRESPLFKCLPKSIFMTRKQRYAVLSCVLVIAAFLTALLFQADCNHVPAAGLCVDKKKRSVITTMLSWNIVFATIWGVLLTVPTPLLLIPLFKKEVVNRNDVSDRSKLMRFWMWKESLAWILVALIHAWCLFFLTQFVRYYTWPLVKKFVSSTILALLYRFLVGPGIRSTALFGLLLCSRSCWCCDTLLVHFPHIMEFPFVSVERKNDEGDLDMEGGQDGMDDHDDGMDDGMGDMGVD